MRHSIQTADASLEPRGQLGLNLCRRHFESLHADKRRARIAVGIVHFFALAGALLTQLELHGMQRIAQIRTNARNFGVRCQAFCFELLGRTQPIRHIDPKIFQSSLLRGIRAVHPDNDRVRRHDRSDANAVCVIASSLPITQRAPDLQAAQPRRKRLGTQRA